MSNKVKRKVTVENSKEGDEHHRRPSVFDRLGPNAVTVAPQPTDRHSRPEQNHNKCRNWYRTGVCSYGDDCKFSHEPLSSSPRKVPKQEKDMEEKDLRYRVRTKREEPKGSRTGSLSPKRVSKRSNSRSRKGEHESKIKSTVVVTRPRSPTAAATEPAETKKKGEGNWEDDSDDWPMDAAQLDFKEELTLERKRQQLQRELALELQKERLLNENVTITKTVSFSGSSSSSSSSDSGSISSSSGSSSSSSEDDSDDSSSSSSSSSSSGSRQPIKKKNKKSSKDTNLSKSFDGKGKDDYDKIKSSRSKSHKTRSPSPVTEGKFGKKAKDKRKSSISPKRRQSDGKGGGDGRNKVRGPRTPSPIPSRKQRQWGQSSSTDSRSADAQKNKGKRHKKKKDGPKGDKYKSARGPSPPPLSSPNRTALLPATSSKKSKRDRSKSHRRGREPSPRLLPRNSGQHQPSVKLINDVRDRHHSRDRKHSKKENKNVQGNKRHESQEKISKRNRDVFTKDPPKREIHKTSLSPPEIMPSSKKLYAPLDHKEKGDRRRISNSPLLGDRRKFINDLVDKKRDLRDVSPRGPDIRRDAYRIGDVQYDKKGEKGKRALSPDIKKGRDDRNRERAADYETTPWAGDHRKPVLSAGRRTPEPRGRHGQPPVLAVDRSRDRLQDRKKRKDRDQSLESERTRLASPRRSQSPLHGHYAVREIEPLTGNRGRIFDPDVPPGEREYAYAYDPLHDPYDRLIPSDYESDVLRDAPLHPEVYPESRYRRDVKDTVDRYAQREVLSPREILPHRDIISLTTRTEDYLSDLPIEDRSYDERWPRGRGRDDWDTLSPAPLLPPHVAAALDEDRYGMPRRRRASPEWSRGRMDDREPAIGAHRPLGRSQLPRDGRSRSPPPPKGPPQNKPGWNAGRHDKNDRFDDQSKIADDRKGKVVRKDRTDRGKRKDDMSVDIKKEKSGKRPHSPSPPPKDNKRRREDTGTPETVSSEKGSHKKFKDDVKGESKSALSRVQKTSKLDTSSPRSDVSHGSLIPEKSERSKFVENRSREDRKSRHNNATEEDEFSDWSDGDDELLNRDDPIDSEVPNENVKPKHKTEEKPVDAKFTVPKTKEKVLKDPQIKKLKDSNKRPTSRDRNLALLDQCFTNFTSKKNAKNRTKSANMEKSEKMKKDPKLSENKTGPLNSEKVSKSTDDFHAKESKASSSAKDAEAPDNSSLKDDTATDVDEYITAESVDYDPISDDELDALIEEPEEPIVKPSNETEKSKIVDALDVNWPALMNETKTEFKPGFGRRRFTAAHVLSRIGFSQVFAGPKLSEKIIKECQKQLDEEKDENEDENAKEPTKKENKKFVMEHPIAAFHVSVAQTKKERFAIFNKVGSFRRALCARRDLQIRNFLCKPLNKFASSTSVSYSPQYNVVDKDLYKQSIELLRQKSPVGNKQPQAVNVC